MTALKEKEVHTPQCLSHIPYFIVSRSAMEYYPGLKECLFSVCLCLPQKPTILHLWTAWLRDWGQLLTCTNLPRGFKNSPIIWCPFVAAGWWPSVCSQRWGDLLNWDWTATVIPGGHRVPYLSQESPNLQAAGNVPGVHSEERTMVPLRYTKRDCD